MNYSSLVINNLMLRPTMQRHQRGHKRESSVGSQDLREKVAESCLKISHWELRLRLWLAVFDKAVHLVAMGHKSDRARKDLWFTMLNTGQTKNDQTEELINREEFLKLAVLADCPIVSKKRVSRQLWSEKQEAKPR